MELYERELGLGMEYFIFLEGYFLISNMRCLGREIIRFIIEVLEIVMVEMIFDE